MPYHRFNDGVGSFEVFYADQNDIDDGSDAGWYWWACFPGALPDSDPVGPFDTELSAIHDAKEV